MKAFWDFLSGKKTIIGGIFALIVGYLQTINVIDADLAQLLLGISALILGTGAVHKIAKSKNGK